MTLQRAVFESVRGRMPDSEYIASQLNASPTSPVRATERLRYAARPEKARASRR